VSYDLSKLGIILSVFLFIDGAAAWLLGVEFSDPVRHAILSPYAPYGLYGGPALLIAACLISFASYYMLARREPELPKILMPVPPTQPATAPPATPPPEPPNQSGVLGRFRRKGKKEEEKVQPAQPAPPEESPMDGQREERLPEPKKGKK